MFRPPFTVLVLKDSHHPVTIRVTWRLLVIPFVLAITLVFLGMFVSRWGLYGTAEDRGSFRQAVSSTGAYANGADIRELNIAGNGDGFVRITFGFAGVPAGTRLYVWLIINPDADVVSEMVVFPRSPLFQGMPVDYRNGRAHVVSREEEMEIVLDDEVEDTVIRRFRILAYAEDGTLTVDTFFVQQ